METNFRELSSNHPQVQSNFNYRCLQIAFGIFVTLHIILMAVIVGSISAIAPEVKTTLNDVNVLVPQMHTTLVELGRMLPEIKLGMSVLEQLCNESPQCSYV
jgi:hypothetical protein